MNQKYLMYFFTVAGITEIYRFFYFHNKRQEISITIFHKNTKLTKKKKSLNKKGLFSFVRVIFKRKKRLCRFINRFLSILLGSVHFYI